MQVALQNCLCCTACCRARKLNYQSVPALVSTKLLEGVVSSCGPRASEKGKPFELVIMSNFFAKFGGRCLADVLVTLGMDAATLPAWCTTVSIPDGVKVVTAADLHCNSDVNVWSTTYAMPFCLLPENGCGPGAFPVMCCGCCCLYASAGFMFFLVCCAVDGLGFFETWAIALGVKIYTGVVPGDEVVKNFQRLNPVEFYKRSAEATRTGFATTHYGTACHSPAVPLLKVSILVPTAQRERVSGTLKPRPEAVSSVDGQVVTLVITLDTVKQFVPAPTVKLLTYLCGVQLAEDPRGYCGDSDDSMTSVPLSSIMGTDLAAQLHAASEAVGVHAAQVVTTPPAETDALNESCFLARSSDESSEGSPPKDDAAAAGTIADGSDDE